MVVDAYEGAGESQYLTECDEYAVVYLACRNSQESARKQCAPEGAHCNGKYELGFSHGSDFLDVSYTTLRSMPILARRRSRTRLGTSSVLRMLLDQQPIALGLSFGCGC